METFSYIGTAQRLGMTAEEVKELVKAKQLKESEPGRITKESVYVYSGIKPEGKQTKKTPVRKPAVVSIEEAAAFLGVDVAEIKRLVEEGTIEIVEGAKGKRGVREATLKMYKKKMDDGEERVNPDAGKQDKEKTEQSVGEAEAAEDAEDTGADTECAASSSEALGDDDTKDACSCDTNEKEEQAEDDNEEDPFDLDAVMEELFPGIQSLPDFVRKAALAPLVHEEVRYSREEMKEAVDIAYMSGKLSVYESLDSFERRAR